jgi:hypothetical protein
MSLPEISERSRAGCLASLSIAARNFDLLRVLCGLVYLRFAVHVLLPLTPAPMPAPYSFSRNAVYFLDGDALGSDSRAVLPIFISPVSALWFPMAPCPFKCVFPP